MGIQDIQVNVQTSDFMAGAGGAAGPAPGTLAMYPKKSAIGMLALSQKLQTKTK
jgi:hypothetical protein